MNLKQNKMDKASNLDSPKYEDFRGKIQRFNFNGVKFNVLFTKSGFMRSGDYHGNTQFDLILKGEFELTQRIGDKDVVARKGPNELIKIPPNTPHLFKAITDTIMIEWWDSPFEATYYQPYRKLIDDQLKRYHKEKNNLCSISLLFFHKLFKPSLR